MTNSPKGLKAKGRQASRLPKPPKKLSREAKQWWSKIVAEWSLDDPGLMLLESAAGGFSTECATRRPCWKKTAPLSSDRFGQLKAHPATLIERDSKGTLLRTMRALNLDLEPLNEKP